MPAPHPTPGQSQAAPCLHPRCVARGVWVASGHTALTPNVPVRSQLASAPPCVWVAAADGSRFSAQVLLAFAPHGCGGDAAGLWLLVGRHVAPAGGDAASKFPYTVGFLVESQCMWVRASALVSQAPVLPNHSTDGVRPPHGALGPAVFVLELL